MIKLMTLLMTILLFVQLTLIRHLVRDWKAVYMDSTIVICYEDQDSSTGPTCEVGTLLREKSTATNSNSYM